MKARGMEHLLSHGLPKGKKGKVKSMTIHKGASGGFIAEHHGEGVYDSQGQKHAIPSMAALKKHLMEHMGDEAKEIEQGSEEEKD